MNCTVCDKPLGRRNKTGRCIAHPLLPSPEVVAKRAAAIRHRYVIDPALRAHQRAFAGCRTEKGKKALSERAKRERLWERGRAAFTPDTYKKRGETIRALRLAHIPAEYRDLYMELRKKSHLSVADATAAVEQQRQADAARFRREVGR